MSLKLSLIISLITWPLYLGLGAVLYLLGLIMVPIALLCGAYAEQWTPFGRFKLLFTWSFMAPWSNLEDGLFPPEYKLRYPNWGFLRLAFTWCALRNPASGLRWAPILSTKIDPFQIHFVGSLGRMGQQYPTLYEEKQPSFVYIWHGYYSCFWWHFKVPFIGRLGRLQLGHKFYANDWWPQDFGYRAHGTGFSAAFKLIQLGENKN